jgi:hypothetical protein
MKVLSKTLTFALALGSFVGNTSTKVQYMANGIFISIAGVSVVISGRIVLLFDNKTIASIGLAFLVLIVSGFCFDFSQNFFTIRVLCIVKAFPPFVSNVEWARIFRANTLGLLFGHHSWRTDFWSLVAVGSLKLGQSRWSTTFCRITAFQSCVVVLLSKRKLFLLAEVTRVFSNRQIAHNFSHIYKCIAPRTKHTIVERLTQLIFSEELFSSWHPFNINVELEEPIVKRLNIHFSRLVWLT